MLPASVHILPVSLEWFSISGIQEIREKKSGENVYSPGIRAASIIQIWSKLSKGLSLQK